MCEGQFSPGFVDDQKSEALDWALDKHSPRLASPTAFLKANLPHKKQIMRKFLEN